MKRLTFKLAILLMLGAIINIAVAWAAALCLNFTSKHDFERVPRSHREVYCESSDGEFPLMGAAMETCYSSIAGCLFQISWRPTHFYEMLPNGFAVQWGWPLRSFSGEHWNLDKTTVRATCLITVNRHRRWPNTNIVIPYESYLPFRPIWPGFAINTLFYAAIVGTLFLVPPMLRRKRRLRRGLCPTCAYPIGSWGGEVCTECGAPRKIPSPSRGRA